MDNRNFADEILARRDKFTDNALASFASAEEFTMRTEQQYVGTEELLFGILQQKDSHGAKLLASHGVTFERVRLSPPFATRLDAVKPGIHFGSRGKQYSETAKITIGMGLSYARDYNQDICGTEHLILSLLQQNQSKAMNLLYDMNIDVNRLMEDVETLVSRHDVYDRIHPDGRTAHKDFNRSRKRMSILDVFGVDFTALAKKNKLDPVIGRQSQIQRAITILNRRFKNNPVLIGESGVGKTAIVEGLAQRIVAEDVPTSLLNKRIVSLDLGSMIAGTKYRGEFEERIKRVMSELNNDNNTILFIDEMHLLVGAGAAEGAIDAGNIFKPALARGGIQVIGATTTNEYTKYIEKDAALERRFQPIIVPEATPAEARAILRGVSQRYADYHNVEISDEILDKTVALADRYINDRFLPDKAIDLLDEAAAYLRVTDLRSYNSRNLHAKDLETLNSKIKMRRLDYDATESPKLDDDHADSQVALATNTKLKLESKHLAHVISVWTNVPIEQIQVVKSEAKFLLTLEKRLQKRVIGQDEAVTAVAQAIRRSRSGLSNPQRPIGSFLFLGPTGVGKTELAKVLAEEFYGRRDSLLKIDMSEFSERHTVARLIGAPPGYVGFDQPGQLTEKIRRSPYSLVLLDEIEKAHPDVFNLLLQILEDGCLTDAKGRKVNFANTIIILTSNLGSEALQKEVSHLGFEVNQPSEADALETVKADHEDKVHRALRNFMKPELVNRLDKVLVFQPLSSSNVAKIVNIQLAELQSRLSDQKIGLVFSASVKKYLGQKGYDVKNGVRSLRRLIQVELENQIAEGILGGQFGIGDLISITLDKGKVKLALVSE